MTSLNHKTISSTQWLSLIAIIIIASNIINISLGEPSWQITRMIDLDTEPETHTWLLTIGPLAIIIILSLIIRIKKYLKGSAKASRLLTIGVIVYFFGSIVLESTLGFLGSNHLDVLHRTEVILEEFFEMIGVIIIISGLMEHNKFLNTNYGIA